MRDEKRNAFSRASAPRWLCLSCSRPSLVDLMLGARLVALQRHPVGLLSRLFRRALAADQQAGSSHRPDKSAAIIERVLSEALSSGHTPAWHGPRIAVRGTEVSDNLKVAQVFVEPMDDAPHGGQEHLRGRLERRRGFLTELVNSYLRQKFAARLEFVWVGAPSPSAAVHKSDFRQRQLAALAKLQAEADSDRREPT